MEIKLLDCTLREGAYVVNSLFGYDTIVDIINTLSTSGIDIIECGWLRNCDYNKNSVFLPDTSSIETFISKQKAQISLMFDSGKYDIDKLSPNSDLVDIIRIAFHKKSIDEMSFEAEKVLAKGYKVFLQPSNIMDYTDCEIEMLCKRANYIGTNALYIVDSFGSMFPDDLMRIMPIFSNLVDKNITLGFHSHNSIQLSFALSIQFIKNMQRNILIDASLCGIGRGAGNTKTELITEFLYRQGKKYSLNSIKNCIDKNILPLYEKYNWEYTPQRAYKGIMGLHPTL